MKQKLLLFLAMLFVSIASAQTSFFRDGLNYYIIPNTTTVEVANGSCYAGDLDLPSIVINNGIPYTVVSIGNQAFYGCSDLTSLIIPNTVTSIGSQTFAYCVNVDAIDIPSSVTSIGGKAFNRCESLTTINLPNSITYLGEYVLADCITLTSVNIPTLITTIPEGMFFGCPKLLSYTVPNGITSIGSLAFYRGFGLVSFVIPSSVNAIGDRAFESCTALTSIICYNETPVTINASVFDGDDIGISTLYVPLGSISAYKNAAIWNKFKFIWPVEFSLSTANATTVGAVKATLSGTVDYTDPSLITERGLVWSTAPNATTDDNKVVIGFGKGEFRQQVSGFSPNTTVYYRTYAIVSGNVLYGKELSFTTNPVLSARAGQRNVSCNAGVDGIAGVLAAGGLSPYFYAWTRNGGTESTSSNLAFGDYTCVITDSEGTEVSKNFILTEPAALSFVPETVPNCFYDTAYDQSISALGGTGLKSFAVSTGSLPSGLTLSSTGKLSGVSTVIGNYTIAITVTDANGCTAIKNYVLQSKPKPITVVVATSQGKVYGEVDGDLTYEVTPSLASGDLFTGVLSRIAEENIGKYEIKQGSLSAGPNYTISYVSADFTISTKPIIVSANASQTKEYGTAEPVFTYTVSPSLIGSDKFTGILKRVAGLNVGNYAMEQGSLTAGSNYNISYIPADFVISKANQIISWNETLLSNCSATSSNVLTPIASSGLPISYTSSDNNIVTVSNDVLTYNKYGFAMITGSQAGDQNYNAAKVVIMPVHNGQPNLIRQHFADVIFFNNSSNEFKSYTWYKNGALVSGQNLQYYKEIGGLNGTYYAIATKIDGSMILSCPLTLNSTVSEENIKIVPNPVGSKASYQLVSNVDASKMQNAKIEIFNVNGVLLQHTTTNDSTTTLQAPATAGIYIVKMTLASGKYFTKNLLVKN